jgi:pyridoxal phosphate enzyme (YggS family)
MAERLAAVRASITEAARQAGRDPNTVTLIGVSKFFPAEAAITAVQLGLLDLGENRVQEMLAKQDILDPLGLKPNWHLIGTLQKNKVKYIIGRTALVHSVDSPELLLEIARRSAASGLTTDVLLQANTAREASKHGFDPDYLLHEARQYQKMPGIRLRGLMTMAPLFDDAEMTRPVFARTQELFRQLAAELPEAQDFNVLSMGMSHDFVQAIACGATHVRIGTAIFGQRTLSV